MHINTFIKDQLYAAGELIRSRYGRQQMISTKENPSDFVTQTDTEIQTEIVAAIKRAFPSHGILSEENIDQPGDGWTWILDPLDGTTNFVSQIPLFGTMLTLCEGEQVMACGVYLPMSDEYFHAELGKGAYLHATKIQATEKTDWPYTFGCSSARINPGKKIIREAMLKASNQNDFWLSCYGSSAISGSFVASGKRDWYLSKGSLVWDYAPIALLMREAGCKVTNLSGDEWTLQDREMLAANPVLHEQLFTLLENA